MPPSSRRSFIALLLALLYFTFLGGSFYSDFNFGLRVFHQIVVTLVLGGWLAWLILRRAPWPRTALDAPLLAWLIANVFSAALGLSPRYSFERLWVAFTLALGFYFLVYLSRQHAAEFVRALYLTAAVVCLIALMEWLSWYFGLPLIPQFAQGWPQISGWRDWWPPFIYRVGLPLNGPTPTSAYLAVLLPPALGLWLTRPAGDDRRALGVWLVLAVLVELLTFSRGGLLALMVSVPMVGAAWLNARRLSRGQWGALAAVGLVAVAVGSLWFNHTFAGRAGSTDFRVRLWQGAAQIFAEHPLVGAGPGNFARAFLRFNEASVPRQQITAAHNLYLNVAAETGIIGLVSGAWLLMALARAGWRRWRVADSLNARLLLAAVGAALCGYAAQSLVDTFLSLPSLLPVLALAAYWCADETQSGHAEARRAEASRLNVQTLRRFAAQGDNSTALPIIAFIGLLAFALWLARVDVADANFERSAQQARAGNFSAAIQSAQQARALDATWSLYMFQLAYLQAQNGQWAEAIQNYRAGLALEPVLGQHSINLAAALYQTGEHESAMALLEQTARAAPDPLAWLNLGYWRERAGQWPAAVTAYGQSLALDPALAGSDFWRADAARAEHWSAIVASAESLATDETARARWRLRIALARADGPQIETSAQAVLAFAPADCEALSAMGRTAQALAAQPACAAAYWARGWAQSEGQLSEADWRRALFLNHPLAGYALGQLFAERGDGAQAAEFYARSIFQHAVSEDVPVALYNRRVAMEALTPLFRIGLNAEQAAPWLALADWRERAGETEAARQLYQALLREDPFVATAQERLQLLAP